MKDNAAIEPFNEAGIAAVEDGHVILDGPDGIAITLTPEAAVATGQSLIDAGKRALKLRKSQMLAIALINNKRL